jgi:hypothetical protein
VTLRASARLVWPVWAVWLVVVLATATITGAVRVVPVFHPRIHPLPLGFTSHGLAWPLHYWDAAWYAQIAAHGYPHHSAREYAFFPVWALLVAGVGVGIGVVWGGVLLGIVSSLLAFLAVAATSPDHDPRRVAIALACLPGSFALALAYPDALATATAAAACACAASPRHRRLGIALAYAAGMLRTNGFLLAVPLAILAWRTRSRLSIAAACAPIAGLLTVVAAFWAVSGIGLASVDAQSRYWGRTGPVATIRMLHGILNQRPLWNLVAAPGLLLAIYLAVVVWRRGETWRPWAWYTSSVILLSVTSGSFGGIERHLIFAFPLVWALAGDTLLARRSVATIGAVANVTLCFLLPSYFP